MLSSRCVVDAWPGLAAAAAALMLLSAAGAEDAPPPRRGIILNFSADSIVGYLPLPAPLDEDTPAKTIVEGFHKMADQYIGTQVSHAFLNVNFQRTAYPSEVCESYWDVPDPRTDTDGWPRRTWLVHRAGVDMYRVLIKRYRRNGVSPWLSVRMNDTHYISDRHKTCSLWWDNPQWRLSGLPSGFQGFDYAVSEVRQHYRDQVRELFERYDADGVELDFMRFPWYFRPGREAQGAQLLTEFVRECRAAADEAARRRGRAVGIAVRVPAVPEAAVGLGMDAARWAREGLIDMLITASIWRPTDTDQPLERWRELMGPAAERVVLAAGADLWLQGTPGGPVMAHDMQSVLGFSAAMLDRGADQVYLFNHFHHGPTRRTVRDAEGRVSYVFDYLDILSRAGSLQTAVGYPRRHVVTWHDPAPPGTDYVPPLPAPLRTGRPAEFRIYTGPAPSASSRVSLRAGLAEMPGMREAVLSAHVNGTPCAAPAELTAKDVPEGRELGPETVKSVAEVAPRVLRFDVPPQAVRRGANLVELSLQQGPEQKLVWLEVHVDPAPAQP